MSKKQKNFIVIIIIGTIIALIIGSTFAYWSWASSNEQKTNVTFTVGDGFSCSANGGGNITSSDVMLAPADCTNSNYAIKRTVTTNITNTTGNDVFMDMWLTVNSIDSELANSDYFRYALTTDSNSCTNNLVAQGNFKGLNANDKVNLLSGIKTSGTYYLYIWLDKLETNNNTQNKSFNLSLGGECNNDTQNMTLYNKIASQADLTTNIDFSQVSSDSNGKGVYRFTGTENNAYPIYYYRGDIDNNNVKFANKCWKIVRTTETGGVKLIYNGLPSNGECTATGTDTLISSTTTKFNTSYNSPSFVGYMFGDVYTYDSASGSGWQYAPDVTYANGAYTLTTKDSYNVEVKNDISGTNLNYHHYTCGSASGTICTTVRYVYYVGGKYSYYITLYNGKKIEDALEDMLTNSSNSTNSTIKDVIDNWYSTNMTSYTNYLEDAVYCNDRSIDNLASSGFNPNGGSTSTALYFNGYNRAYTTHIPSLNCQNKADSFTVAESNLGNGKLIYPVGLLTSDEAMLAGMIGGSGSVNYLQNSINFWLISPYNWNFHNPIEFYISFGSLVSGYGSSSYGARPVISLKSGMKISGGDGSKITPYEVNVS